MADSLFLWEQEKRFFTGLNGIVVDSRIRLVDSFASSMFHEVEVRSSGPKFTLSHDATIISVATGLKHPVEYVRRVLAAFVDLGALKNPDDYLLSLSLQSDPAAPDYRVIEVMDEEGGIMVLTARSGKTHKEISSERYTSVVWSDEYSRINEVRSLIGRLRLSPS